MIKLIWAIVCILYSAVFLLLLYRDIGVGAYELSKSAKEIHEKLFPSPLEIHQKLYGYDPHNDANNIHPIYSSLNSNINSKSHKSDKNYKLSNGNVSRSLAGQERDVCPKCSNLDVCRSLNNKMVQEKYDPAHIRTKITCTVLEDLGHRLSEEIFGNGKSFRDTPECRDVVMQYLCLFWGSENLMYTNSCLYKEDTNNAIEELKRFAPRPPCRSFCVQVSLVCAQNKEFGQLCGNIACPPEEEECTPDPTVDEQKLNMGLGCELPYDLNPYVRIRGSASKKIMNADSYKFITFTLTLLSTILIMI
jgi:hypothetical protein